MISKKHKFSPENYTNDLVVFNDIHNFIHVTEYAYNHCLNVKVTENKKSASCLVLETQTYDR